ncbi:2307_t:CDS:2, partial [Paraglomus brasilianum]
IIKFQEELIAEAPSEIRSDFFVRFYLADNKGIQLQLDLKDYQAVADLARERFNVTLVYQTLRKDKLSSRHTTLPKSTIDTEYSCTVGDQKYSSYDDDL